MKGNDNFETAFINQTPGSWTRLVSTVIVRNVQREIHKKKYDSRDYILMNLKNQASIVGTVFRFSSTPVSQKLV